MKHLNSVRTVVGLAFVFLSFTFSFKIEDKVALPWSWVALEIALAVTSLVLIWCEVPAKYRANKRLFRELGGEVLGGAPTILGWIAYSDKWIATSETMLGVHRIEADDIENILWGDPSGRVTQTNPGMPSNDIFRIFEQDPRCFWILVMSKSNPKYSVFVAFSKQRDRDLWLEIAKTVAGISDRVGVRCSMPKTWSFVQKSLTTDHWQFTYGTFFLFFMATLPAPKLITKLMQLSYLACFFPIGKNVDRNVTVPLLRVRVNRFLQGFEGDQRSPLSSQIQGDQLFVLQFPSRGNRQTQIPLDLISNVELKDRGMNFYDRPLAKLFAKDLPSPNLHLVVETNDPEYPMVDVRLPRDEAKALFEELSNTLRPASA